MDQVDQHLAEIDRHLGKVDQRLDKFDQRFDSVDQRLDQVEVGIRGLAQGQARHDGAIAKLTEQVARMAGLVGTLAGEVHHLVEAQKRTEATVERLGQRMDAYAQEVTRGFTKRDAEHAELEARVTVLERRGQ